MAAWLGRFSEPQLIRRRGVVEHVACRDVKSGERRVVLATKEQRLRELLDNVARLHGVLDHVNIPALDHRGSASGTEYVALRSNAFVDLETMLPIALANHGLAPQATIVFLDAVIGAVRAAHATPDPRTNEPICIGAFAGSNVLVSETHVEVIGWGYPTKETDRRIVLNDQSVMHVAWEASFGAPASPHGDLDAVARFFHAVLPASAMPPVLIAAVRGQVSDERIAALVDLIAKLEESAHARDPLKRSWDVYVDCLHRITGALESKPDMAVLRRELVRLCNIWRAETGLHVAEDGSWFSLRSGARIELDHRPNLCGMLAALVARRRDAPGEPLSAELLVAAGWPGERIATDAGRNRVRVGVSTLRSMGLRDVLLSRDDGYLIDPDVALRVE